ncbi:MAG: hypothetical protein JWL73_2864 [Actinomycetia bacterium]|nr:hypothetical protein [Actinomycetes bacterium]
MAALDRFEVEDLLHEYLEALDGNDRERFLATFTPDATILIDYGTHTETYSGSDGLNEFHAPRGGTAFHLTTDSRVEWDGETAIRSARFLAFPAAAADGIPVVRWIGRSRDTVVRTEAGWRISLRELWVLQGASPHPPQDGDG